jgi:hypothetical protein
VAPRIDRHALMDVKIRAGANFDFDVPVIGEPPPSKEWTLKGNALFNTDRIKVTNENYNTKLRVIDAKRADSGVYTLTAKNINGTDTATVNVVVLGKLSQPTIILSSFKNTYKRLIIIEKIVIITCRCATTP